MCRTCSRIRGIHVYRPVRRECSGTHPPTVLSPNGYGHADPVCEDVRSVEELRRCLEGILRAHHAQSLADTRFPWITQYDTITLPTETREYKYLRQMDGGNLLYIYQYIHDEKRILVKFVRTYSKEAYLASAAEDGAPALFGYHDVLSCGWSVVVMELLEEPDWVSVLKIVDKAEQRMVCDKVKEHVLTLHEKGFVHGDIRFQNVLVKRPSAGNGDTLSVRLIDFDWAGEVNKGKYPFFVNPDLGHEFKRPSGVKGGGLITTQHDLTMVDFGYLYTTSYRYPSRSGTPASPRLQPGGFCITIKYRAYILFR